MSAVPRRVVTGHDAGGRSVLASDGPVPAVYGAPDGPQFLEIWSTGAAPAPIAASEPEPTDAPLSVPPPVRGTVFRINVMPPGSDTPMHKTESVDYAMVLEGEIVLVVDDGETVLRPGDIVVQRGTSHRWTNRTDVTCRMLFVLVDGAYSSELRDSLGAAADDTFPRDGLNLPRA